MSQETRKTIYLIYGVALTLLILVVGVMLVASCIRIYESGDAPFTRASIAAALKPLGIPAFLLLDLLLAGVLLSIVLPLDAERVRPIRENAAVLARLQKRTGEISDRREHKKRTVIRISAAALTLLLYVYPTVYLLTPSHFTLEGLTEDVRRAALTVLIATALALVVVTVASLLVSASLKREIEETKALLAMQEQSPVARVGDEAPHRTGKLRAFLTAHEKKICLCVRVAVLTVAVLFIVLGVLNGGAKDVLAKAARICTECIGLG